MGVINIRVVAGGALSGSAARHPLGSPPPAPIGSGGSYDTDVARARRLQPLVDEGHADSLIEASLRFVIANDAVSTVLLGIRRWSTSKYAAKSINKGPLSATALARAAELQRGFAGEAR